MLVQRLHHVAYRCPSMPKQTVEVPKKASRHGLCARHRRGPGAVHRRTGPLHAHLFDMGQGQRARLFELPKQSDHGTRRKHAKVGPASGDEGRLRRYLAEGKGKTSRPAASK